MASTAGRYRAPPPRRLRPACSSEPPPRLWFRHPLLAEVLPTTYLPGEAGPVHAAWANQLAEEPSDGVDEVRRLGDLALHLEAAGDLAGCVTASLAAADQAAQLAPVA